MYGKNEKKKMLSGKLYIANDPQLAIDNKKCRMLVRLFNSTTEEQQDYRRQLLRELLGGCGEKYYIEPPIHFDYGCNTYIGENFYANFDCIILDVNKVVIGDNVMFGPRVNVFTAGHPVDAEVRAELLEYGYQITIGNNVWVGGNSTINPGVTIGDNVVIGSGSVVTRDIPSNVVAAGNPCRVIRNVTDKDKEFWQQQREEYFTSED